MEVELEEVQIIRVRVRGPYGTLTLILTLTLTLTLILTLILTLTLIWEDERELEQSKRAFSLERNKCAKMRNYEDAAVGEVQLGLGLGTTRM